MKYIIPFVFSFILISNAYAQESGVGLRLGMNLANFSGSGKGADYRAGLMISGYGINKISNKFAIQPELQLGAWGTETGKDPGIVGDEVMIAEKLTYINLKVLASYKLVKTLYLKAGPYGGILLAAKRGHVGQSIPGSAASSSFGDIQDEFKDLDYGLSSELAWHVTDQLNINLGYSMGFNQINASDPGKTKYNRLFQFTMGYHFVSKK